jgi:hypothetical protein
MGRRVGAAKINAESVRKLTVEAAREADRAEAQLLLLRMDGFGGPALGSGNAFKVVKVTALTPRAFAP